MANWQARFGDTETCCNCPKPPYCPTGPLTIMQCVRTYVNGRIASVVGDGITCCSIATAIEGSGSAVWEGSYAHRLGDANTCGNCIQASPDTFIGD